LKAFAYVNPANEREAVAALKTDGIAMVIGGGQDLLARMKDYIDSFSEFGFTYENAFIPDLLAERCSQPAGPLPRGLN